MFKKKKKVAEAEVKEKPKSDDKKLRSQAEIRNAMYGKKEGKK